MSDRPTTPTEALTQAMNDLAADLVKATDRFAATMMVGINLPDSADEEAILDEAALAPLFAALTNLSRHSSTTHGAVEDLVARFRGVRRHMGIKPVCPCWGCVDKAAEQAVKATDDVATAAPIPTPPRPTHGPNGQPLN